MPKPKSVCAYPDPWTVRFPQGMLDMLRDQALRANRSLNAEIIYGLRNWVNDPTLNEEESITHRQPVER